MGGSPLYVVDKKLGKGGFGQVYLGRRAQPTKDKDGANANVVGAAALAQLLLSRCSCPVCFLSLPSLWVTVRRGSLFDRNMAAILWPQWLFCDACFMPTHAAPHRSALGRAAPAGCSEAGAPQQQGLQLWTAV